MRRPVDSARKGRVLSRFSRWGTAIVWLLVASVGLEAQGVTAGPPYPMARPALSRGLTFARPAAPPPARVRLPGPYVPGRRGPASSAGSTSPRGPVASNRGPVYVPPPSPVAEHVMEGVVGAILGGLVLKAMSK